MQLNKPICKRKSILFTHNLYPHCCTHKHTFTLNRKHPLFSK